MRRIALLLVLMSTPTLAQDWAASCLVARGQDKVLTCTKATEAAPNDLALKRQLGRALLDIGEGMLASGEFGAIAAARPDDAFAWYEYALVLATDYRFAEAITAIDKSLKLDPRPLEANKVAVLAYERLGRLEEAYQANLRLAAVGDAIGMYDIAEALLAGRGVAVDAPGAVPWFKRAAEAGHFGAMAKLSEIYAEGLYGQPRDPVQSAEWKKRAE